MDVIRQIFRVFLSNEDNHKKDDDLIEEEAAAACIIEMEESAEQNTQEFIQQTLDYFKETLGNGRALEYVNDLKMGLARTGDGIESELLWWTPVDHPVGAMLDQNPQIVSKGAIDAGRHGKLVIHTDANVRLCVEEIVTLLETHRSIKLLLESDQEKVKDTLNPVTKTD
jgi:hypothetical protein